MKKVILVLCTTSLLSIPLAHAKSKDKPANQENTENIEVTPDRASVTSEELAAIYVLSKLCKSYGFKDQNYKDGYTALVKENLPNERDPVHALEVLAKDKSFKNVLNQAEQDAKKAGDTQNKEICQEISTLSNSKAQ